MDAGQAKRLLRRVVGDQRVRRIKGLRLRFAERLGVERWSRPALNGLDARLVELVGDGPPGTFVEFGANDGLQQSNTYALERELGWRGVLIEAVPELAAECARNRPMAQVVCAAVSSFDHEGQPIGVVAEDLMGSVGESRISAAATSLSRVIDWLPNSHADLVCIDVEGYEITALQGLDLTRHRPRYLLIETNDAERVAAMLSPHYGAPERWSHHDHLFTAVEPTAP